MSLPVAPHIVIAGAGSVGCYVGACLALDGRKVTFLLRPVMAAQLQAYGLRVTDYQGRSRQLAAAALKLSSDPGVLAEADIVLVTVKSAASPTIAAEIARHARPGAVVVSLQNGVGNAELLAQALPDQQVLAGMVPFNVLQQGEGRFHRGSEGELAIAAALPGLAELLACEGLACRAHADMAAVQWGKLLLNLNNALNALAGVPLREQLQEHAWRRLLAGMMDEALHAMKRAGIRPAKVSRVPSWLIPHLLRLPTPLFRRVAASMLTIDPLARSSMWEDLQQRRITEVAYLQGAVVALATSQGIRAPWCERVMAAIHAAEQAGEGSPRLSPRALA
ncbi:2-dehydropantoate 2-reductase [Chitinimonas viridis]|uniref:2-dehydropantoate 2-reductase n=1 Tax=Chitinimonas viridis TaxID=664880 RepID=A0ABT8B1P4_9NEIS|nr:2-dehydropantoate 2-reductase [Chitinimonas viridis]MDN3576159.1 2-dehydropantoate 2-reductase [Chitinimonas viridis]